MKKLLISLGILLAVFTIFVSGCGSDKSKATTNSSPSQKQETTTETKEANVPREHRNALKAAEQYLSTMPFSKQGLYDQLTSPAGNQFPAEAAQYAIDNIKADWNEQALKAAKQYLKTMPMSDAQLHEQLTSPAGSKFTNEQADYAISHLDK